MVKRIETTPKEGWSSYLGVVLICFVTAIVAVALRGALAEANLVLLYLLSVVVATVRFGRGPGILSSVLAVLAFDVLLVEPLYSFRVADPQYLITLAIMLTVSLIISHLTANLRRQAIIAKARARHADAQCSLSTDLAGALTVTQIGEIASRHLATAFNGAGNVLLVDSGGVLDCTPLTAVPKVERETASLMAQAVFERARQEDTPNAVSITGQLQFIQLRAPSRVHGVLVLFNGDCRTPEQLRLLQAFTAQIALAVERVHYADMSRQTALEVESERLRNSLLSAVSHDVRTPLAAIVGFASTLVNTERLPADTIRELAQAIQDDAGRMNDLVTNLLDLARLQTNGARLNREWQMIEEVIGSALASSRHAIAPMEIELALPTHLPLIAYDAVLLERVLCNLLENAARHAAAGGWIGIAAVLNDTELRISVTDRGLGVTQENEDRIFEKFVHSIGVPSRDGVGLGLAICRTIVEAHGGRIWVEPATDIGACFIFTLPLGTPPDTSTCAVGALQ